MTGQNAARHRTTNWIDPAANNRDAQGPPDWNWRGLTKTAVTLPSLLRAAGYRTIHVGKAHFGPNDSEGADPLNLGFDVNVGGRGDRPSRELLRPGGVRQGRHARRARTSSATMARRRFSPMRSRSRPKRASPAR